MTRESTLIALALMDATRKGWRLFRNSVGRAWHGRVTEEYMVDDRRAGRVKVIELFGAYMQSYGLAVGSHDLIGWRSVTITPEMVGQQIAQFVSVECKTPHVRVSDGQRNWSEQVRDAGGLVLIARLGKEGKVEYGEVESCHEKQE